MLISVIQRQYEGNMMTLCDVILITLMQRQYNENMMTL